MSKRDNAASQAAGSAGRPVRTIGWLLASGVAVLGGAFGLRHLEQKANADPRLREQPRFELIAAPPGLDERILAQLAVLEDAEWIDPGLCSRVADILAGNAWVRQVKAVRKTHVPTIEIECDYRAPAAFVQGRGDFFLVDEERVRLPGQYQYHPYLLKVEGVNGPPPAAGRTWAAPELAAAMAIIQVVAKEPYRSQVTGIRVSNYRGRENRRAPQIVLTTDQPGGAIIWGSAPGEEVEENTVPQKLAILRANFAKHGRADAGKPVIDISTLPGRFSSPASP